MAAETPAPPAKSRQEAFDPAVYKKISTGRVKIEGRIDLHGLSESEAHTRLTNFIESAWNDGRRRLLVITGKGRGGLSPIRAAVPKWLTAPNLARYVSSFDYAATGHGGDGALYVMLRKSR